MKYAILLVLLISVSAAQTIDECEKMTPGERDGCYLSRSRLPTQCDNIKDFHMRDQCFISYAETHASSYRECDSLFFQYQALCYSRIAYGNNEDISYCEKLDSNYVKDCYVYYITHGYPDRIVACEQIPPQYRKACKYEFFEIYDPKNEQECEKYFGRRYTPDCTDYIGSKTNAVGIAVDVIVIIMTFLTAPETIALSALIMAVAILSLFVAIWFKSKKKN